MSCVSIIGDEIPSQFNHGQNNNSFLYACVSAAEKAHLLFNNILLTFE